jgi:flavorubredoxin
VVITKYVKIKDIDYVIATHQDQDIVSSLDKWLMYSGAKIVISQRQPGGGPTTRD